MCTWDMIKNKNLLAHLFYYGIVDKNLLELALNGAARE